MRFDASLAGEAVANIGRMQWIIETVSPRDRFSIVRDNGTVLNVTKNCRDTFGELRTRFVVVGGLKDPKTFCDNAARRKES